MAKFVCLLVFLAVLVNTGFSLKCYRCNSEKVDGCLKSANPGDLDCAVAPANQKSVCYYKHSYDNTKKLDIINATCGQIASTAALVKESLTDCTPMAGTTVKECRVCDSNLCNSAPVFSTTLVALLCLPMLYLVNKFLL